MNFSKYSKYKIEIVLLSLSLIFTIGSFILSLMNQEDKYLFFMRAGSIMVLLSAIVEYKINNRWLILFNRKFTASLRTKQPLKIEPPEEEKQIILINHWFLIIGTLIWGYGDLLITLLKN